MPIDRIKVRKDAEKFLAAGKVDRAIEEYRKLVEDNPKDLGLMNTFGDLHSQAGRTQEAVEIFKRLAITYERDGYAQKASAILKKTVRLAPDDMDIAQRLADVYRQTGMIREAVATHLQVAEYFQKKGLIKRALEEFAKVVDLDPKNLKNKVKLADLYNKEGMRDRAASIYLEVAEALGMESMHAEANQILERAKAMTTSPQVFLTQSRLSVIQGDYSTAAAQLRQGLESNARSAELLEALAEIEIRANNPERALEALGQIPQLAEKSLPLGERALRLMVQGGRTEEGLRLFSPIAREMGRRGSSDGVTRAMKNALQGAMTLDAWTLLAEVAHQGGRRDQQIMALQNAHALAERAGDAGAMGRVKQQLAELGVSPEQAPMANAPTPSGTFMGLSASSAEMPAMGERHTETEIDPLKRMKVDQLARQAEAFFRSGSTDRAVDAYKQALQLDPTNFELIEAIANVHRAAGMLTRVQQQYLQSAQVLHGLGKLKEATHLLDKAEVLFPGSTRIHRRTMGLPDYNAQAPGMQPVSPSAPAAIPMPAPRPDPFAPAATVQLPLPPTERTQITPPAPPPMPEPAPVAFAPEAIIPLDLPGFAEPEPPTQPGIAAYTPEPLPPTMPPPLPAAAFLPPPPTEPLALSPGDFDLEPLPPTMPPPLPAAAFLPPPPPPMPPTAPVPAFTAPEPIAAGPVSAPEPAAIPDELASLLSDIDFQLDYGSPEEAKLEIEAGLRDFPGHPELTERLERAEAALEKLGHGSKKAEALAEDDFANSFFDLTDVLGTALMDSGEGEEMHDATKVVDKVQSVDELFSAFREGVEKQVGGEDFDTHYNLGIAYKEMMLLEPAIDEFKKVLRDPERTLECCSMLSICEQAKGDLEAAMVWLKKGIEAPGFPPEDSIGLRYDLGLLYTEMGHTAAAQEEFRQVWELDPEYRDVASKLQ